MLDRCTLLVLSALVLLLTGGPLSVAAESILDEARKAQLLALASARGELAVIVGFAVPGLPPGGKRGEADETIRAVDPVRAHEWTPAIAEAGAQLLADLGVHADLHGVWSGPGIHTVKRYETIPFVTLTASPDALARLLANPLVTSVQPDEAVPPL